MESKPEEEKKTEGEVTAEKHTELKVEGKETINEIEIV